jgi:UPF0755 protein
MIRIPDSIRKCFRWRALVGVYVVFFLAYQVFTFLYIPPERHAKSKVIYIRPKTKFLTISRQLEDEGIIRSSFKFAILAKLTGSVNQVRAGEYELSPSMLPREVLNKLVNGWVIQHMLTIPEGYNIYQIADTLDKEGLVKKQEFLAKAFDQDLISSLGFEGPSLEGYLFPDTYEFWRDMQTEDVLRKMTARFKKIYSQKYAEEAKGQGLSMRDVVTLASIIEKETGTPGERRLISAVFHNRLRRGMPLQADPTVIYGIRDFNGNLTRKDLQTPTPYNTYIIKGLPPGPIACPGEAAIKAVLNPVKKRYLYFVSKNDGSHYFSSTLEAHQRAVAIYQKKPVLDVPASTTTD